MHTLPLFSRPFGSPCCPEHGMSGACFSADRRFRYALWRNWSEAAPAVFLLLNPSIADEERLDPTLTRCSNFARDIGYGGMLIFNLFPIVSTDPKGMLEAPDRDGEERRNLDHIVRAANQYGNLILGFGSIPHDKGLIDAVARLKSVLEAEAPSMRASALALTNEGWPRHPLYLKANLRPVPYEWPRILEPA